LSIVHQFIPPTIHHQEGDEDCDLDYVPGKSRGMEVRVVLSNSFAFGGNCTTLVFGKYNPPSPPFTKGGLGGLG